MVGSDLEPKAGAASADLEEIATSGIDLSRNKVVVCAGGSPHWHNEQVNKDQINILALQEQGFTSVSTMESASMGTAEQLSSFLNYCYENYSSDEYALILWDHGNGPVMGYGKDILYGNDALLLSEMAQAMESSVFSEEKKLAWVGFDACLMASAELSCLLSDYANYLIASQEIEPAFGWDYSFLAQLGSVDTPQLLKKITDDYMAACDAYYKERNYDHYDVTLSVVDLSYASELENAINSLFSAASGEVSHYYDLLAMNRVQSRALGRATTGSEYDLVDLKDMTVQLSAQYPELTRTLLDVIDRMVVVNATSIESCCGMSLYYPFYNKYYYEKDWKKVYTELDIFPDYRSYLEGYEKTWLKEDKLEMMTLGAVPEETAKNTYSITLNNEQAKSYGSATYHVLKRESGDIYRQVYSSQDVSWENNTLTAEYDGMAIYIHTNGGNTFIPPISAVDQIDRLYRYSGMFQLSNMTYKPDGLTDKELPKETTNNWRYLLTLNSETGKVEMSGTVPYTENSAQDLVEYGRIAEADLSTYGSINFYYSQARYITRYDNGIIKPLNQWYSTGITTWNSVPLAEGYSFEYAPLAGGEYYLMFEITDTQSGVYCTELLPITVENVEEPEEKLPVTTSEWKQGEDRVLLKEQDGLKIYLTTRDTQSNGMRYFIEAENANEYAVKIQLHNTVANGTLLTENANIFTVNSYDFMYEELRFGISEETGDLEDLTSLSFEIKVTKDRSGAIVWPKQLLQVDVSFAPAVDYLSQYKNCLDYDTSYLGAKAEKQVVYESESLRLTLMGVGGSSKATYSKDTFWIYAENLSEKELNLGIFGFVVNGYFISTNSEEALPGGMQTYLDVWLGGDSWRALAFDQINSLSLLAAASETELWWMNKTECLWCPVELSQTGTNQTAKAGKVLWEEEHVRVAVYKENAKNGEWQLLIENNSDRNISIEVVDELFDGTVPNPLHTVSISNGKVGAGQRCICDLTLIDLLDNQPIPEIISFYFQIRTFDETQVLYTATQSVTLSTK